MSTISEIVTGIISRAPFLEEALNDGLINVSALARNILPEVKQQYGDEVKAGAVVMAINRMAPGYYKKINIGIKDFVHRLGDIISRSNLEDYTYAYSPTLIRKQLNLLHTIGTDRRIFYTFSRGISETTIVISNAAREYMKKIFSGETLLSKKENLASITLQLPEDSTEITGVYYFILKNLAWKGIPITEVISTTNEFTIVVSERDIEKAFSILVNLKR
ncbi:MAG: aspartate kinase [Chlorobi bacterium]|nr:aspartate kinase [Chlorobiota bacterium]